MDLGDLISPEGVVVGLKAKTKKAALSDIAARAGSMTGLDQGIVFEQLLQRERLGSTGLGAGIAIPHARLGGLTRVFCLFAKLEEPLDFESVDGQPVDLIFLLLAPEAAGADHLKALARISRLMREPRAVEKLRAARSKAVIYSILTEPLASNAA